ncbi:hypothetical protein [Prochlorothrix hollandica]|uniref:hypothetical protein n=1 Tax=Prochlorothrix hollandica TaxID=1223 RepID=UPI00034BA545|nr:hypothetical protein [Prochlorothrix hollandica]
MVLSYNNIPRKHFSTMPRKHTEANTYLDLYKLQLEKQRLKCKLQGMEQQTLQLQQRLVEIEGEMGSLQAEVQEAIAAAKGTPDPAAPIPPRPLTFRSAHPRPPASGLPRNQNSPDTFNTIFVEY